MNRWIQYFIENNKVVNIITLVITIVGALALYNIKKDLHPAFKFNVITITAQHPTASAEEVERLVTYPIEESLKNIEEIEEYSSTTTTGRSVIQVKFPYEVKNINDKIIEIKDEVDRLSQFLPSDLKSIQVSQIKDNDVFVANYVIKGIDPYNLEHHQFIYKLKNEITKVDGIKRVQSNLKPFHIFIRFKPERLKELDIKISDIKKSIIELTRSSAIGYSSQNGKDWLIEFEQNSLKIEDLKKLILTSNLSGNKVVLASVAEVKFDLERNDNYIFLHNGQRGVELTIYKSTQSDIIKSFENLKKVIDEIPFPEGVSKELLHDGPYFIEQQIDVLVSNGVGGLILVLIMLALTMGWRTSLMTAIGLPIAYFGTFIALKAMGLSIDLISIIAMILVVGNLVDDAVIFSERYNQLLSEGTDAKKAATQAAQELITPVTGTILTIICAFLPILYIKSELSIIFYAIPIVVSTALLLSWFETFFILPNHLQHYVKKPQGERANTFFHYLTRGYKKCLSHILNFRYLYGLASVALLGFSLFTASRMPQDFSLYINSPQVEIFVKLNSIKTYEEVEKILLPLHQKISQIPKEKLDFVETNLGWVWHEGKTYKGPQYATLRLVLNKHEVDVKTLRAQVLSETENIIKDFKDENIAEIKVVSSERGGNSRKLNTATIQIKGRDEKSFQAAKEVLIQKYQNRGLVQAYRPPDEVGPDTFQFLPNTLNLKQAQLDKLQLAEALQAQTTSTEVAEIRQSGRWMSIFIEPLNLGPPSLNVLGNMKVLHPQTFEWVSLEGLGQWKLVGYTEAIRHRNGERVLNVEFGFNNEATNEQVIKKEIEKNLAETQKLFPMLTFKVIDSNEQDKAGRSWTLQIVMASALLIYLILAMTLRSWSQPFIVGLPIPFAFIGVIWALKFHDMQLGLMAMIGLIGTMGVSVNDSIVMVHQVNLLKSKWGSLTREIIINGAASRLRAIFLTASCTLVGVFPTAYGLGGESGFTQPLAFSMGWGLTASLCLTLFIIPAMLLVFEDISKLLNKIKKRVSKSSSHVSTTNKNMDECEAKI